MFREADRLPFARRILLVVAGAGLLLAILGSASAQVADVHMGTLDCGQSGFVRFSFPPNSSVSAHYGNYKAIDSPLGFYATDGIDTAGDPLFWDTDADGTISAGDIQFASFNGDGGGSMILSNSPLVGLPLLNALPGAAIRFVDVGNNGELDVTDPLFLAAGAAVMVGDMQLAGSGASFGSRDVGAAVGDSFALEQLQFSFVDNNLNNQLDPGDWVFVDSDGDNQVSEGDVRIVPSGSFKPGTVVLATDSDAAAGYPLMPAPGRAASLDVHAVDVEVGAVHEGAGYHFVEFRVQDGAKPGPRDVWVHVTTSGRGPLYPVANALELCPSLGVLRPDLGVASVAAKPSVVDGVLDFAVTVENLAVDRYDARDGAVVTLTASDFGTIDPEMPTSISLFLPDVPAGGSVLLEGSMPVPAGTGQVGLAIVVDPAGVASESDRSNNFHNHTVTIQGVTGTGKVIENPTLDWEVAAGGAAGGAAVAGTAGHLALRGRKLPRSRPDRKQIDNEGGDDSCFPGQMRVEETEVEASLGASRVKVVGIHRDDLGPWPVVEAEGEREAWLQQLQDLVDQARSSGGVELAASSVQEVAEVLHARMASLARLEPDCQVLEACALLSNVRFQVKAVGRVCRLSRRWGKARELKWEHEVVREHPHVIASLASASLTEGGGAMTQLQDALVEFVKKMSLGGHAASLDLKATGAGVSIDGSF